ncbi:hypothetical protein DKX38_016486 [Salix brachista]|uniref:Uncharacterized protein n=1 Tax=Salix brachista TaxID=2182728 RepID=A0A5N5L830_9ROSI|nr:hypothetical protein DKX38_016486 [Salix brachista]
MQRFPHMFDTLPSWHIDSKRLQMFLYALRKKGQNTSPLAMSIRVHSKSPVVDYHVHWMGNIEEEASSTTGEEENAGNLEISSVLEDGFEKELMGLTGGFPGGEKGLEKFIEKTHLQRNN